MELSPRCPAGREFFLWASCRSAPWARCLSAGSRKGIAGKTRPCDNIVNAADVPDGRATASYRRVAEGSGTRVTGNGRRPRMQPGRSRVRCASIRSHGRQELRKGCGKLQAALEGKPRQPAPALIRIQAPPGKPGLTSAWPWPCRKKCRRHCRSRRLSRPSTGCCRLAYPAIAGRAGRWRDPASSAAGR